METKGDTISRVRGLVKGEKVDAFLTDRFLYSLVLTCAKVFIKRMDDQNKLGRYNSLFQKLPGVLMEDISPIEAGCIDIDTCYTFKRTKDKLPAILEGSYGPIIRSVTSIDGSKDTIRTQAKLYTKMTHSSTFKYNKNIYYWILDERIIFPNAEWPVIDIDAMWEVDIEEYRCDASNCCVSRRDEKTNIPDSLFSDIEEMVRQKLLNLMQIPADNKADNQSNLR